MLSKLKVKSIVNGIKRAIIKVNLEGGIQIIGDDENRKYKLKLKPQLDRK